MHQSVRWDNGHMCTGHIGFGGAVKHRRIRMMVDDVAEIALWDAERISECLEDELPLPDHLRDRLKGWAREYSDSISRGVSWSAAEYVDFDRRGYDISRELQSVLGPDYVVEYHFVSEEGRRALRDDAD